MVSTSFGAEGEPNRKTPSPARFAAAVRWLCLRFGVSHRLSSCFHPAHFVAQNGVGDAFVLVFLLISEVQCDTAPKSVWVLPTCLIKIDFKACVDKKKFFGHQLSWADSSENCPPN